MSEHDFNMVDLCRRCGVWSEAAPARCEADESARNLEAARREREWRQLTARMIEFLNHGMTTN